MLTSEEIASARLHCETSGEKSRVLTQMLDEIERLYKEMAQVRKGMRELTDTLNPGESPMMECDWCESKIGMEIVPGEIDWIKDCGYLFCSEECHAAYLHVL